MPVNFPTQEVAELEKSIDMGGQALRVYQSDEWGWIYEKIFGAMQDQAVNILKTAKNDEDRVKAQQIFIAAHKPKELIEQLIRNGEAAKLALKEISTLEGENNGEA